MASIVKHGDKWRAYFFRDGVRKTKVCKTKREAKEWVAETSLATPVDQIVTLHAAVQRYIAEESVKHKGHRWEKIRLEKLMREIKDKAIADVTNADIAAWRDAKTISAGSILREMKLLNSVFEHCRRDWGYIKTNPMADVKKPSAPPARRRGVSADEIKLVCERLGYSDELPVVTKKQEVAVMFLLGIETAMRKGEMLSLTPDQIDLERQTVELIATKNGDKRQVPLSTRAVELFKKLPEGCFTVSSASADALFRTARPVGLHFHDSRSEAITRLAKKLEVLDLARAIGHRDPRSLMLYYSETAEQLAKKLG